MQNHDAIYEDFASKISFLEFIQDEFRNADIPVSKLQNEIAELSSRANWGTEDLAEYIKRNPKSFQIFEALFQQLRFTNAQLIHFVFDITRLNTLNIESIYEYVILNLKHDEEFKKVFYSVLQPNFNYEDFMEKIEKLSKKQIIASFKIAISKYIDKISRDFKVLEQRITKREFEDFSIRFANYLISNLKINDMLGSVNLYQYLQNKRIPVDTKGLHGKYAKIKVKKILDDRGYICVDHLLEQNNISTLQFSRCNKILNSLGEKVYCTEKYVEGIVKPKENKLKKFDLIIFKETKPKYLFEINFYSTEGTKIGINQNEYIDLNNLIKDKYPQCSFYWISDGNYWLTSQGKSRFVNLLNHFQQILNINIFAEKLDGFI
ncbi:MAG: type II restriction endonuclease [bacterium]|nr:type II restriction endonuclease [bacterium]